LSINRRAQFVRWFDKEFYRKVHVYNGLGHQLAKAKVTLASTAVIACSLYAKSQVGIALLGF
jgi:hypothetical protein